MFDGLISPVQPDGNIPGQIAGPWEQGSHAPEVVYTLQEQCDDDYFLNVKSRGENAMMKVLRSGFQRCQANVRSLKLRIADLLR